MTHELKRVMEFVVSGGMFKTLESSVDGRWVGLQWRIQDFPQERANSQSGCANLLFCIFFAENCMAAPGYPRGSANS